jgi:hypothetical protein
LQLQLTPFPPPLQLLLYLQDMVRSAGGAPVVDYLDVQGLNAAISCLDWGAPRLPPQLS